MMEIKNNPYLSKKNISLINVCHLIKWYKFKSKCGGNRLKVFLVKRFELKKYF